MEGIKQVVIVLREPWGSGTGTLPGAEQKEVGLSMNAKKKPHPLKNNVRTLKITNCFLSKINLSPERSFSSFIPESSCCFCRLLEGLGLGFALHDLLH